MNEIKMNIVGTGKVGHNWVKELILTSVYLESVGLGQVAAIRRHLGPQESGYIHHRLFSNIPR